VLLTLAIREILPATPRARVVRLDLGGRSFTYAPGQAVLVGAHGAPKRRPYSIAASPEDAARDDCLELLVGVDLAGSTTHLPLEPGATIDVEGPMGTFVFPRDPTERRFVFIAGGTGIAPLRAMLHHALAIPHGEIGLYYSARTPDEFAYEREFRALAAEGRIELHQAVTRAIDGPWSGIRGRIGRSELEPLVHSRKTLCFVCGPPALVTEMTTLLGDLGIARERIRAEEWSTNS
jgi:NAD(P)H-flavin reductase